MTEVLLPDPVLRPPEPAHHVDLAALAADLRAVADGEVRFDDGSRAAYSTDASNYRQVPLGVVVPRTVQAAVAAVDRRGCPGTACSPPPLIPHLAEHGGQPGRATARERGRARLTGNGHSLLR